MSRAWSRPGWPTLHSQVAHAESLIRAQRIPKSLGEDRPFRSRKAMPRGTLRTRGLSFGIEIWTGQGEVDADANRFEPTPVQDSRRRSRRAEIPSLPRTVISFGRRRVTASGHSEMLLGVWRERKRLAATGQQKSTPFRRLYGGAIEPISMIEYLTGPPPGTNALALSKSPSAHSVAESGGSPTSSYCVQLSSWASPMRSPSGPRM